MRAGVVDYKSHLFPFPLPFNVHPFCDIYFDKARRKILMVFQILLFFNGKAHFRRQSGKIWLSRLSSSIRWALLWCRWNVRSLIIYRVSQIFLWEGGREQQKVVFDFVAHLLFQSSWINCLFTLSAEHSWACTYLGFGELTWIFTYVKY